MVYCTVYLVGGGLAVMLPVGIADGGEGAFVAACFCLLIGIGVPPMMPVWALVVI